MSIALGPNDFLPCNFAGVGGLRFGRRCAREVLIIYTGDIDEPHDLASGTSSQSIAIRAEKPRKKRNELFRL